MTDLNIEGHEGGIRLWSLMASTQDPEEQGYYSRLSQAATQYGQVWFTDCVTQRETKQNQTIWHMTWNATAAKWNISLFLVPQGAAELTDRLLPEIQLEDILWKDIDPNDLVVT